MSNDLDEATRLLSDLIRTIETAITEAEDTGRRSTWKRPFATRRKLRLASQP